MLIGSYPTDGKIPSSGVGGRGHNHKAIWAQFLRQYLAFPGAPALALGSGEEKTKDPADNMNYSQCNHAGECCNGLHVDCSVYCRFGNGDSIHFQGVYKE